MRYLLAAICLVLTPVLGCNERTRDAGVPIYFSGDAGNDAADATDEPDLGPPDCQGQEGSTCRLPRAFGVCLSNRCSLVACVSGFTDCDGDRSNGCEVQVDTEDSCGSCGVACGAAERCQLGPLGFVCSAEPVCRPGTFDLDLQVGCEWQSDWANGRSRPTPDYEPELLFERRDGTVWTVGRIDERGAVAPLAQAAFEPVGLPVPAGPVTGIDEDEDELFVAWSSGLTRISESASTTLPVECTFEQNLVDVSLSELVSVVATEHALLSWTNRDTCIDCEPVGPRFDSEDYLAALWPGRTSFSFAPDEVASCTPCDRDEPGAQTSAACNPNTCRPAAEPLECADCDPLGCPDFNVVRVLQNGRSDRVYVVTERGLVVMRYRAGWEVVARFEEPFVPGEVSGKAFVDASLSSDGGTETVTLLDNAGRVLNIVFALNGDYQSTSTDISVGSGRQLIRYQGVSMVRGSTEDFLIGKNGPSAAIHRLDTADGPGIANLELLVAGSTSEGFLLLYETQGLIFERTLSGPD